MGHYAPWVELCFHPLMSDWWVMQCPINGSFLFQHIRPTIYIPPGTLIQIHRAFHWAEFHFHPLMPNWWVIHVLAHQTYYLHTIGHTYWILSHNFIVCRFIWIVIIIIVKLLILHWCIVVPLPYPSKCQHPILMLLLLVVGFEIVLPDNPANVSVLI